MKMWGMKRFTRGGHRFIFKVRFVSSLTYNTPYENIYVCVCVYIYIYKRKRQGRREERRGGEEEGRRREEEKEEERRRSKCIASKNKNPTLRMWGTRTPHLGCGE